MIAYSCQSSTSNRQSQHNQHLQFSACPNQPLLLFPSPVRDSSPKNIDVVFHAEGNDVGHCCHEKWLETTLISSTKVGSLESRISCSNKVDKQTSECVSVLIFWKFCFPHPISVHLRTARNLDSHSTHPIGQLHVPVDLKHANCH